MSSYRTGTVFTGVRKASGDGRHGNMTAHYRIALIRAIMSCHRYSSRGAVIRTSFGSLKQRITVLPLM